MNQTRVAYIYDVHMYIQKSDNCMFFAVRNALNFMAEEAKDVKLVNIIYACTCDLEYYTRICHNL